MEKVLSCILFFHMCKILIVTIMLMSAKENIALSGSKVIFVFLLVNLILNIDIKKVFIGNKYCILMRNGQQK